MNRISAGVSRLSAVCTLSLISIVMGPTSVVSQETSPDDPAARKLMSRIEEKMRWGSRVFSMDVHLNLSEGRSEERFIVGVLRNDEGLTRILYVFISPENYRGSSLLIHDNTDGSVTDRTWVYYPGLDSFR